MPPVIVSAVVATVASTAGAYIMGSITASAIASYAIKSFAINVVLSLASKALSPKPSQPQLPNFDQRASGRILNIRQPIMARQLLYGEVKTGGAVVFLESTDNNEYMHIIYAMAGHEVNSLGAIFFDDQEVPLDGDGEATGTFEGYARVKKHLGTDTQDADADLVAESDGKWTTDHRLRGIAYLYVRLKFNNDLYPNGIPNISCLVQGKKIYDPRTTTTVYSTNPALVINDYLKETYFGLGCSDLEVNSNLITSCANTCDENVNLATGGTEKRYTANGIIDSSQTPKQIIEDLISSCGGTLSYAGGKFNLKVASYSTPTVTLTEKDITGAIQVTTKTSRRDQFNAVKGTFLGEVTNYVPTDYPPIKSDTFKAEDNNEEIFVDMPLSFTNSSPTAQRLAKIALYRSRQQISAVVPCNLSAFQLAVGDTVQITNTRLGWSAKTFEVAGWNANIATETDEVILDVREITSSVYDWDAEETAFVKDNTNLPNPISITAPSTPTITESLYITRDGAGVKAKAVISWVASPDAFVEEYEVEYKLTTETTYNRLARTEATSTEILDIASGVYDFRIRGISSLGVRSAYTTHQQEIFGLGTAPSAIANLSLESLGGIAILNWDQVTDLDVKIGGKIRFRHAPATSGATWQGSINIGEAVAGTATQVALPLLQGTYLAKAVDSSGIASDTATSVTTEGHTVIAFGNTSTVTESPSFSGTKTDVMVTDDDKLQLDGSGLLDSVSDFDAITDFDFIGGIDDEGTYIFASGIDKTTQKRVRLTSNVVANVTNQLDQIDSRATNIDSWESFDGTATANANAVPYYRTTNDDPTSSPTWSDWKQFMATEEYARAFQFKLALSSSDEAYNIQVSTLACSASEIV